MTGTAHVPDPAMQQEAAGSNVQSGGLTDVPERPMLAPNVQLCGTMESGFADQQWLVQRAGSFTQLPELFYRVAEYANGARTLAEIADAVSTATGRRLTTEQIRLIVGAKLIPKGIVATSAQSDAAAAKASRAGSRPPLGMVLRTKMIRPRFIDPITQRLQFLYLPPVLIAILILVVVGHAWLYVAHDLGANLTDLLAILPMIPAVVLINIVAAAFHELGHATALRYGGGQVRGIGAGLYLVYPVFFTDVTDNYRLGRWARVRTDLGGFYFTLIFALGMMALYLLTGQRLFLLVVLLLDFEILAQSLPFVRFDGYWVLADLTGIPDFFSQMGAFVRAVLPLPRWKGYRLPKLKGWVMVAFGAYIVVTAPLLVFLLVGLVQNLPRIVAVTWASLGKEVRVFATALQIGDLLGVMAAVLQLVLLALPTLGLLLILFNVGRTLLKALWQWSKPLPARSVVRVLGVATIVSFVAFLWLPQKSLTMLPLLRRLPQNSMAARDAVWEQVGALSGRYQPGDIGNLVLVTTLALIALELCFVLFDLINLAATAGRRRWQQHTRARGNQLLSRDPTLFPAEPAGSAVPQEHHSWLSHVAAELGQAGKTDREIQDLLIGAGLDPNAATLMVMSLAAGRLSARKHALRQGVLTSAIVSTLGALLMLGAWWAGVNAGILVLAGCATVGTSVRLLRGLIQHWLLSTSISDSAALPAAVRRVSKPLQQHLAWSVAGVLLLGAGYGLWDVYRDELPVGGQEAAVSPGAPGTIQAMQAETTGSATAHAATLRADESERKDTLASAPSHESVSVAPGSTRQSENVDVPPSSAPGNRAVPTPAHPLPSPGTSATPSSPSISDGVVRADGVALHTGPGAAYPVVRELAVHVPLEIVGQAATPTWFNVRLRDGSEGWIVDNPRLVQLNRPRASIPQLLVRPMTGIVHQQLPLAGVGELQIANAAAKDGLITLARAGQPGVSVYVRAGEIYTLRGIPDGAYTVVTSQGDGWNGTSFTRNVNPKRVKESVTFETTAQEYTVWEISVVDGSAK